MNTPPFTRETVDELAMTGKNAIQALVANDRAQREQIIALVGFLEEAMDEMGMEDTIWHEDATNFLKEMEKQKINQDNNLFNRKNGHQPLPIIVTGETNLPIPDVTLSLGTNLNDPAMAGKLNQIEKEFGEQMSENELAVFFHEKAPKKKRMNKSLNKMSLEEIVEWEKQQDNSNDIYKVAARVKNFARESGASLTPAGEALLNTFTHVFKSVYDFAETLANKEEKIALIKLIKTQESKPAALVATFSNKKK